VVHYLRNYIFSLFLHQRRDPPQPEYREDPPYHEPRNRYQGDYPSDGRYPHQTDDYRNSNGYDYGQPEPSREEYDYHQQPPLRNEGYQQYRRRDDVDDEEDLPVLRDPNYEMPKPIPDSPPTRPPPEVRAKPNVNAVK